MRCEEFELRLNEVLDERRPLSSAADIQQHARLCADCRKIARSYETMIAGLHYVSVPAEPAGLTARIVQEARLAAARSPRAIVLRFPRPLPAMALAAAVVLLAVGLAWLAHQRHGDGTPNASGTDKLLAHVDKLPGNRHVPRRDDASSTGSGLPEHVKTMASRDSSPPDNIPTNNANPSDTGELVGSIPAAEWAQPGAEWAQGVADGLQPVTRPTVGAINGFLNLWGVRPQGRRS